MRKTLFALIVLCCASLSSKIDAQAIVDINGQSTISQFAALLQKSQPIAANISDMQLIDQQRKEISLDLTVLQPAINHGLRVLEFNSHSSVGLEKLKNTSNLVLIDTALEPSMDEFAYSTNLCLRHKLAAYVVKIDTLQASDLFPIWRRLSTDTTLIYANHMMIIGNKMAAAYLNKTVPPHTVLIDMSLTALAKTAVQLPGNVELDDSFYFPLMNKNKGVDETKTIFLINSAFALGRSQKEKFSANNFSFSKHLIKRLDKKNMLYLKKVALTQGSLHADGNDVIDGFYNTSPKINELTISDNPEFEMDSNTSDELKKFSDLTNLSVQGNDQIQHFSSNLLRWINKSSFCAIGLNISDDDEAQQFIDMLSHKQFQEVNIDFFPYVSPDKMLNVVEAIAKTQRGLKRFSTNLSLRYARFSSDQLIRLMTARALIAKENQMQGGTSLEEVNNFAADPINEARPAHEQISPYFQKADTSWNRIGGKFKFNLNFTRVAMIPSAQDKAALLKLLTQNASSKLSVMVVLPISTVDKELLNNMLSHDVKIQMTSSVIELGSM